MQRWFAIQSERREERLALREIACRGFETFLPLDERTLDPKPLFPSYLFAFFDPSQDQWQSLIAKARGVRCLLGLERPTPLPVGCVEELQGRALAGEFAQREPFAAPIEYAPGDLVRVTEGPWWSHSGLVEKSDRERVWILLRIFNRIEPVPVKRKHIERAA